MTLLVEQEAEGRRRRDEGAVREKIKEMIQARLAGHDNVEVWPANSGAVPDKQAVFSGRLSAA